jgi:beta-lactamase superfamily II metal-dependent hydrolase
MLTLRVIHAHEGDCLLLIYGANGDRHLLVDGGPKDTFLPHLQAVLQGLPKTPLDICLSHVDTDHTTGLMELLAEIRDQRADGDPELVAVNDLWINSFGTTIDAGGGNRQGRLAGVLAASGPQGQRMRLASVALQGVKHGHDLVVLAQQLGIQVNGRTGGAPLVADALPRFSLDGVTIDVVGPTKKNLDALRKAWDAWLSDQEERIALGKLRLAAMADKSIPNLSSIQLLVECDGKRLLLTGDGRGDHLLEALEDADLLDEDGGIDVDVLKVQHHGSDRNATLEFFERVRASTYVISADGKHDNPDRATLEWIHKAAKKQGRKFKLVLTNLPEDAEAFTIDHPPGPMYSLEVRDQDSDFIDIEVAP